MSAEAVITTMKAVLRHIAKNAPVPTRAHTLRAADYFMEETVRWCVNEYFRRP